MSVTIKDIAEVVGVSNPAVSAVLNNKNRNCRVSAETRARILEAARSMGYVPSISARIMRGMATKTVAVISSHVSLRFDEHVNTLILELFHQFNQAEFSCFHAVFTDCAPDNLKMVQELISRGVRHFVVIGEPIDGAGVEAELLRSEHCSYIQYMGNFRRRVITVMDDAMRQMWEGLEENERRHFKLLTCDSDGSNSRIVALRALFPGKNPAEIEREYVVRFAMDADYRCHYVHGLKMTEKLLKDFPETKVIFYHSDHFLLGGVAYLLRHGYRIGEEIKLFGVNNSTAVENHAVPIVSAAFDVVEMAELLHRNIFGTEQMEKTVQFQLFANKASELRPRLG